MFRRNMKIWSLAALAAAAVLGLAACGSSQGGAGTTASADSSAADASSAEGSEAAESGASDTATIGFSTALPSINPLAEDATEAMKYATSLQFLPLLALDRDLNFVPQLAEDITTEDNQSFTIKLNPEASWSDGEPVSAQDVLFSFLSYSRPTVGATALLLNKIEGIGDDGLTTAGAESIDGISIIDDKTLSVRTKAPMSATAFKNIYGRYLHILPQHALKDIPEEQLLTSEWFNAPSVVSGPYFVKSYDLNHYVNYEANDKYFMGAPRIKNLSIKIVEPSQLLAGLQSGELDFVQQTTGNILQEDYETLKGLEQVKSYVGKPMTAQGLFFNVQRVDNQKVRQAILYGIDRQTLLKEFNAGMGEVVDGFAASSSPYYDSTLSVTAYDPEKARALLEEARAEGFDTSRELELYINSGDSTFMQAATYLSQQLTELGLKIKINTVQLAELLEKAVGGEADMVAVQYTFNPLDIYTDAAWLLSNDGWAKYQNQAVSDALAKTQTDTSKEAVTADYRLVDEAMQQDVPMINLYVMSAMGAHSQRLKNAVPDVFGSFVNVHEWELQ